MIVKIFGGLGNQMFQYAYGRNLELNGKKIVFDISFFSGHKYKSDTARNYKLDKFNIKTQAEFSIKHHQIFDLFIKIKRRLGLETDQYFQNEQYFKNIADIIRQEFTLKSSLSVKAQEILNQIKNSQSVAIHIRRGDYITDKKTNEYHGVCDLNYYKKAITIIKSKCQQPTFFIFSDDIEWAKANMSGENMVIVSDLTIEDVEEMFLMSQCQHNIIANSSFSWWGAWLNNNQDKIVIVPKKRFNNELANKKYLIPPKNWLQI